MEIEAKFRQNKDTEDKVREIASFVKEVKQVDTIYNALDRNFVKTNEVIRVRCTNDSKYVLTYKKKLTKTGVKKNIEIESEVDSRIYSILEPILKKELEVKKSRRYYEFEGADICIDDVDKLGEFIEIEGKTEKQVKDIVKQLGFDMKDCVDKTYPQMMREVLYKSKA